MIDVASVERKATTWNHKVKYALWGFWWGSAQLNDKDVVAPQFADKIPTLELDQGFAFRMCCDVTSTHRRSRFSIQKTITNLCQFYGPSSLSDFQLQRRQEPSGCNPLVNSNLEVPLTASPRITWHSTVTALRAAASPQLSPKAMKPRESTRQLEA
jgi:hypothetical protein